MATKPILHEIHNFSICRVQMHGRCHVWPSVLSWLESSLTAVVLPVLSCFSAYSRSTVFTVVSPITPEDSRQFFIQGHGPGNVCSQSVIMTMAISGAAEAAASVISGCNGPA